jgi:hypothetical protein
MVHCHGRHGMTCQRVCTTIALLEKAGTGRMMRWQDKCRNPMIRQSGDACGLERDSRITNLQSSVHISRGNEGGRTNLTVIGTGLVVDLQKRGPN